MSIDFSTIVKDSCYARIGLLGNPSDGFKGKTISFLIGNFKATACIVAQHIEEGIEISEPVYFDNLGSLCAHSQKIVSPIAQRAYKTISTISAAGAIFVGLFQWTKATSGHLQGFCRAVQ